MRPEIDLDNQISTWHLPEYDSNRSGVKPDFMRMGGVIVNAAGEAVSDHFHSFSELHTRHADGQNFVRLKLGKLGACTSILRAETDSEGEMRWLTSEENYHDISYRRDLGHLIGKSGSMTYLIDGEAEKISKGYFHIFMNKGQILGSMAVTTEPVIIGRFESIAAERNSIQEEMRELISMGARTDTLDYYREQLQKLDQREARLRKA